MKTGRDNIGAIAASPPLTRCAARITRLPVTCELVFIAATLDRKIRAINANAGAIVWKAPLSSSVTATPMTYEFGGRQYILIVVVSDPRAGTKLSDAVVAPASSR
jgi:glucose dehydrogenase